MKSFICAFVLAVTAHTVFAVPQQINYQGSLTNTVGLPLDTTVSMTFNLYGISDGGVSFWSETHPAVNVVDGLFRVDLGSVSAMNDALFSSGDRWLGITIGNNSEMTPRQQFLSVATAFRVNTIDAATGGYISGNVNIYGKASIGSFNSNEGTGAFVVGANNHARGDYSVIGGGGNSSPVDSNSVSGPWGTISGGRHNTVVGLQGTIAGGNTNTVSGTDATISGGSFNVASAYGTAVSGGLDNVASQSYATISGGISNRVSGQFATVSGGNTNIASNGFAAIGGGSNNRARGEYSVVAGGGGAFESDSNSAIGDHSTVGGGEENISSGPYSTVAGGHDNLSSAQFATVSGGRLNLASNENATVGGGSFNKARGFCSVVAGGGSTVESDSNSARGVQSAIGGGYRNDASNTAATIAGGAHNVASGLYSTVGGGLYNKARADFAVVAGGGGPFESDSNSATGSNSVIVGGKQNVASGTLSSVGGGRANLATQYAAVVGGGTFNEATELFATVCGGSGNSAPGNSSTVAGGVNNHATGVSSAVGGGVGNVAGGSNSCIPGGNWNRTAGFGAFAAGHNAYANHDGSFVWGTSDTTGSFGESTVTFRCANGARFYTAASGIGTGVSLPAGGGAWGALCDVNQKRLHGDVNTSDVLQRVSELPLHRWSYKSQDENIQHIGPTAQDFYAAFELGDNNTTISTLDPDGVALAAIQELVKQNEERKMMNEELKKEVAQQAARYEDVTMELAELRAAVQTLQAINQHSDNKTAK